MSQYIFRFPVDTPPLTYGELRERCTADRPGQIGTTVALYPCINHDGAEYVAFYLYGLELANIYADRVDFTEHGDRHTATTEWLARICYDNGIRGGVYTEHFVRYVGSTPLEGSTFPVSEASPR